MSTHRRSKTRIFQTVSLAGALILGGLVQATSAGAADPTTDGTSPTSAAASCWEVKQTNPQATSGVFWLSTPALKAPQQFYCDQETDGGGWVLVGRGREGWSQAYSGIGSSAAVRDIVTGPDAFRVAQLPARTIDALLDNGRVDGLEDGVRLRRATDVTGSTWQEARFKFAKRDRWVWTPAAGHPIGSFTFDASSGSGGATSTFGKDDTFQRVDTRFYINSQFRAAGWAFGANARGSSDSQSYIWAENTSIGSPRPFTQVFLRPKLLQSNLVRAAIPDQGLAGEEQRVLPQSGAEQTVWGVTGLANGRSSELDAEVQGFAQVGSTVFSVGNFRYVQQSENGEGRVEQPYVAGFDVKSGQFVSTFRPVLNGQVKAVAALPNGLLLVVGEFTTVNGTPSPGVAALNPVTGALSTSWSVRMENRLTGGVLSVRSVSISKDFVYFGGAFTHLSGGTRTSPAYSRGAARVSLSNGTPDATWNPAFNGTVVSVDAADDQRMYAAGYFSLSNQQTATRVAAVKAAPGQPAELAADWPFTSSNANEPNYQQTIKKVEGRVWVGGSQHSLFTFDTASFARLSGNITRSGGDFQTMTASNGVVFAGCHCDDWSYSNAFTYPDPGKSWTQGDKIGFVGAWDARSGEYVPDFAPVLRGRKGIGAWGSFADSTGAVWIGGDFISSQRTNGQVQWSGGFARFSLRDSSAPAVPGNPAATTDGVKDTLSWTGVQGASYEILRTDRVVAMSTSAQVTLPSSPQGTKYFVRAVDAAGNRSATTAAFSVPPVVVAEPDPVPSQSAELIKNGAEWKYRFENSAPAVDWKSPSFDDSTWLRGAAPLGFGHTSIVTPLSFTGTKPLTAYYRKGFQIADVTKIQDVTITTKADDGIVVYVNGVEVSRANMPAGVPNFSTYASSAPTTSSAPVVKVTVPAAAFTNGPNVITTEVHSNYRSTPNTSMELSATATLTASVQAPAGEG
ncbi:fibrinogen-like YCDxxxxGGGW domain-containing protein [Arthrobacter sp. MDB2-24]